MYKIDLHSHSIASPDGALKVKDYAAMLAGGRLDAVAVTDHNTITFATALKHQLGDRIIIGEEISTLEGEIIGLYLEKPIKPGLSLLQTIKQIQRQKGLVYIPHPFETVRKGVSKATLDQVASAVDIIEIFNGRAYFQNTSKLAMKWAAKHRTAGASSSDAHGRRGWGQTYTRAKQLPSRKNLVSLLRGAEYATGRVGLVGVLYPKLNRLKKGLHIS